MVLEQSCPKKIDEVDLQIIRALEENSRISIRKLAQKIGLTSNVLNSRIRSLERGGIITGYIPIINAAKMGFDVTAIIFIQIAG